MIINFVYYYMYLDAIDKAAINNMDLKLLKSVKVMVEKLDTRNLLINCLKLNNVLNWEKTLNNSPSGFQQESTSSNLNINVIKNVSDGVDLNAENGLEEYIVKDQSTDVPKRSISSEKHLKTEKKKCISVSGTCNLKNPIFARSTRASHTLNYNYDTEVNSLKSSCVIKQRITLPHSLRSLNLSASKQTSRFKRIRRKYT